MSEERRKTDKLIWYFMVTAMSIIIIGGGAWATNINEKIDKVESLEVNVQYIQRDISDIKQVIMSVMKRR